MRHICNTVVARIDRRRARQKRVRLCRTSVIAERRQEGIQRGSYGADLVAVDTVGEAGAAVTLADQVIALRDESAVNVAHRSRSIGDDRVDDVQAASNRKDATRNSVGGGADVAGHSSGAWVIV